MLAWVISDGVGVLEMMTLYDKEVEVHVKNPWMLDVYKKILKKGMDLGEKALVKRG